MSHLSHAGEVWARVGDSSHQVITLAESKYHVVYVIKPDDSGVVHELVTIMGAKRFHEDFYIVQGGESPEQKQLADSIRAAEASAVLSAAESGR